jgi:hypothetical protein
MRIGLPGFEALAGLVGKARNRLKPRFRRGGLALSGQLFMPGVAPRRMKAAEAAPMPPERRAWEPDPLFSGQLLMPRPAPVRNLSMGRRMRIGLPGFEALAGLVGKARNRLKPRFRRGGLALSGQLLMPRPAPVRNLSMGRRMRIGLPGFGASAGLVGKARNRLKPRFRRGGLALSGQLFMPRPAPVRNLSMGRRMRIGLPGFEALAGLVGKARNRLKPRFRRGGLALSGQSAAARREPAGGRSRRARPRSIRRRRTAWASAPRASP